MPFDQMRCGEKLALLINSCNAFTQRLIPEHGPATSIVDIPGAEPDIRRLHDDGSLNRDPLAAGAT